MTAPDIEVTSVAGSCTKLAVGKRQAQPKGHGSTDIVTTDIVGAPMPPDALRIFMERDIPQMLEQTIRRCLSTHEQMLQDMLREEHAPLSVSLTRLSSQIVQRRPEAAGGADTGRGDSSVGVKLDALGARIDKLTGLVEKNQDSLNDFMGIAKQSMGEALAENLLPFMRQMSADAAAPRAAAPRHTQERQTQTSDELQGPLRSSRSNLEEDAASVLALSTAMSQMLEVAADEDEDDDVKPPRHPGSAAMDPSIHGTLKVLRRRIRDLYTQQAHSIEKAIATQGWLEFTVRSFTFEMVFSAVIISHLIYMVLETDRSFGETVSHDYNVWVEACFLLLYSIELAMKLSVYGRRFFFGHGMYSNWFDVLLIVAGTIDIVSLQWAEADVLNSMALKGLRILRLQRVLRLKRLFRMAGDLNMIIDGLAACFSCLCGASLLVFIYLVVAALFFTQAVSGYIYSHGAGMQKEVLDYYTVNFSTVFRCMFTLYQNVSGGVDWSYTWAALAPVWPASGLGVVFVFFHFVYLVLIANVVASVYVQKVLLYSLEQTQKAKLRQERRDRKDIQMLLDDCEHNFGVGDTINYKEFLHLMLIPEVRELFDMRGVKLADATMAHKMLALPARGAEDWEFNADRKDFFQLCMRMARENSVYDFARTQSEFRRFVCDQRAQGERLETALTDLKKEMDSVWQNVRRLRE